jgi:hypothetical protein
MNENCMTESIAGSKKKADETQYQVVARWK